MQVLVLGQFGDLCSSDTSLPSWKTTCSVAARGPRINVVTSGRRNRLATAVLTRRVDRFGQGVLEVADVEIPGAVIGCIDVGDVPGQQFVTPLGERQRLLERRNGCGVEDAEHD